MATLARMLPGGGGAPSYEIAWRTSQYLLYHLVGAVLTRVTGDAMLANGLLLAAVAVLFPLSLRALLRAFGRDERLAIFGCMPFWSRATMIGFLPFVASIPLALFAIAAVVRAIEAPSRKRAAVVALLGVAVFYTHVSTWTLFVLVAAALAALRRRPLALLALLPSILAAAMWWHGGSLEEPSGDLARTERLPAGVLASALPIWTFEIWRSHLDELCAAIWWAAFAAVLVLTLRRRSGFAGRRPPSADRRSAVGLALVPVACAVLLYVATPFKVGAASFLDLRLAPVVAMLAVLVLRPPEARAGDLVLAPVALASLLTAGDAAFEMRRAAREHLGDFDALLAHVRPGSRLAMLNFKRASRRTNFWPYAFAGSYARANGGGVASYSFSEIAHWPLRYAPGAAPPSHGPFWIFRPCAYRYRSDGAYYDYVLVQGDLDPFADPTPGPAFRPVAHEGTFTLYEKNASVVDDDARDHGPCRAP